MGSKTRLLSTKILWLNPDKIHGRSPQRNPSGEILWRGKTKQHQMIKIKTVTTTIACEPARSEMANKAEPVLPQH